MSTNIFINQNLPSRQTSLSKNEAEDSIYARVLMQMSDADRSLSQMISKDNIGKINQLITDNKDDIQYVKKIILAIASEVLNIDFFFDADNSKSYADVEDVLDKSLKIAGNFELDMFDINVDEPDDTLNLGFIGTERAQIRNLIPKVYYRPSFQMMTDTNVEVLPIGCYKNLENIKEEFQKLLSRTFDDIGGENSKATVLKLLSTIFNETFSTQEDLTADYFLKINDARALIEDHITILNSIYTYRPGGLKAYRDLYTTSSDKEKTTLKSIPYLTIYDMHKEKTDDDIIKIEEEKILTLQKFLIFIFKNLNYGTINYK